MGFRDAGLIVFPAADFRGSDDDFEYQGFSCSKMC